MKDNHFVLQTYKKDGAYSYTTGAYATIELLKTQPQIARVVYIHSKYTETEYLTGLCRDSGVPVVFGDKYFARVNQKENAYVMGVFEKNNQVLQAECLHVLLVNPNDMGNIGTIIRTAAGLGLCDLGVVLPAGDVFHPKTVRASMGAVFHVRIQCFENFEAYRTAFSGHHCYPFMLDGAVELGGGKDFIKKPYTLIFGNEASGLDPSFAGCGVSVRIPQTARVDSLNVAVAVGIGIFAFQP